MNSQGRGDPLCNQLSFVSTLSEDPADLDQLDIYQQERPVARHTARVDGRDYDTTAKRLTFYGPACDALRGNRFSGARLRGLAGGFRRPDPFCTSEAGELPVPEQGPEVPAIGG